MKKNTIFLNRRIRFWGILFAVCFMNSTCFMFTQLPVNVRAADSLIYNDGVDDLYMYYPNETDPISCVGPVGGYSAYDVKKIDLIKDSNGFHCNLTFNGIVTPENLYIMLFFDINATYDDINDVRPYIFEYQFFIDIMASGTNRYCFNYTSQHLGDPIVHDEYTIEMLLPADHLPWIESTPNLQEVDDWNVWGYSRFNLTDEYMGWDYLNWPRRFYNDQLRLEQPLEWWVYVLIIGGAAVVCITTILILKKKGIILRQRDQTGSKSPDQPQSEGK